MPAAANDNGRSLEFLLTEKLSYVPGGTLTSRARANQLRDRETLTRIHPRLRRTLERAADVVVDWLLRTELSESEIAFQIDRHSDSEKGVADLSIEKPSGYASFSIKHNHDALSHPRPYSLAQWLGFGKGSGIDLDHRRRMQQVSNSFRRAINGAQLFSEVPRQKWDLYKAICVESDATLQTVIKEDGVARIFSHLVGNNFQKVIVRTDHGSQTLSSIEVVDYSGIKSPTSLISSVDVKKRSISLDIEFDNGWKIDMRIHNASSRIADSGQLSLKFDAQREYGPSLPTTQLFP